MTTYRSTICESINERTGKSRFYIEKCGVFQRVSAEEFRARDRLADWYESRWNQSVRGVRRFYTTVVWIE